MVFDQRIEILVVEPYLTASHKHWANLLQKHLPFQVNILSLPGRHWKWRMHYGGLHLAQLLDKQSCSPDIIITSEMMDLALFKAASRALGDIPILLYWHEHQIGYPSSKADQDVHLRRDHHYGFINFTSAWVADRLIFNSPYHQKDFFARLTPFLQQFPDSISDHDLRRIKVKSTVIEPGIDTSQLKMHRIRSSTDAPIILWNHRWEYDKNPELFFKVLKKMKTKQVPFKLVLLGPTPAKLPTYLEEARHLFADNILHFGYLSSCESYCEWMWKADVVISTSIQDFWGISVAEALFCECLPLLPNRLSFPDLLPADLHDKYLYQDEDDLVTKLMALLTATENYQEDIPALTQHVHQYDIQRLVPKYLELFREVML